MEAQGLLDEGLEVPDVARRLGILTNTLHKAIRAGRSHNAVKKRQRAVGGEGSGRTASQRSVADSELRPACSHAGVRKTSSNTCANTTILTV